MKLQLSLGILLLASVLPLHAAERKPALWAVYYAWYQTGGKSSMWTVDGTAQPRSKAEPLIGYYDRSNVGLALPDNATPPLGLEWRSRSHRLAS